MLHPQAKLLLELMENSGLPATHQLSPAEARAAYRDRRSFTQPQPPDVALVADTRAGDINGGVPIRLYRPIGSAPNEALPVLVYYHGGGFVIGDLETHDTLCRELCNLSGCAVIAVDYRLAPEGRFPAAVDDCLAATLWIHRHAAEMGCDPNRIAVGGDSAGGNLAAVVSIAARDLGSLPIKFQMLIYPATDSRRIAASHTINGSGYLLTREMISYFHEHYVNGPADDLDWKASPLLHDDLSNLPPALVITAGYDPLRDEGLAYCQRLTEAGVDASHICFERQIHGFITMGKIINEANTAVAICASELRRHLA